MTPWQIAKDSESSHQIALFCWAAKAQTVGFKIAFMQDAYNAKEHPLVKCLPREPIPELKWLHHIPNGGSRGDTAKSRAIAGGQLKAEGVKSGVFDLFWPLPRLDYDLIDRIERGYAGLYIEMKKPAEYRKDNPKAGCSEAQKEFGDFAHSQGYYVAVCYSWDEAAEVIRDYYEEKL
jgi:hypothetical protein